MHRAGTIGSIKVLFMHTATVITVGILWFRCGQLCSFNWASCC